MTEAQFITFIKSQLRRASQRWKPINNVFKKSRYSRGVYLCTGYNCNSHYVPVSVKVNGKSVKNVFVDHITPVINPEEGFTSWDVFINNLYCEEDNLQVLCGDCHDKKTLEEKILAKERREKEKEKMLTIEDIKLLFISQGFPEDYFKVTIDENNGILIFETKDIYCSNKYSELDFHFVNNFVKMCVFSFILKMTK